MSGNTKWVIGEAPVVVEGELSDYPDTTFGETVTFKFYIKGDGKKGQSEQTKTGATYGNSTGATYGGPHGATYGGGGGKLAPTTPADRYNKLKDYLNYAGYATTQKTLSDVYFYEDHVDFSRTTVDTLLVGIHPKSGVDEARGVWGVITGGDDTTEIFGAIARVSLDVFVLAEYSEFDTEADVRAAFEKTI